MELRKNYTFGSFRIRINWLLAACVVITAATFMRLGLWQLWQLRWRMGSMSLWNVTSSDWASKAAGMDSSAATAALASVEIDSVMRIIATPHSFGVRQTLGVSAWVNGPEFNISRVYLNF